jgi:hypothetical protein
MLTLDVPGEIKVRETKDQNAFGDFLDRQAPTATECANNRPSVLIILVITRIPPGQGSSVHSLSYKDASRLIEPVIVERECAGLPSANSEGPPSRERD